MALPYVRHNFSDRGGAARTRQSPPKLQPKISLSRRFYLKPQPERGKIIGFVGFDDVATLDLLGPLEAFAKARIDETSGTPCYETLILGVAAKRFTSESKVSFRARCLLANAPELDTIIVPGGSGLQRAETRSAVATWISARAARLRRVVSISNGIYAAAATGLLAGRSVTTHWRFAQDLAHRFSTVRVSQMESFLKDGPFYSSGGGPAAIEMTLSLIEEDYGRRVALEVARDLVSQLRPAGDNNGIFLLPEYETEPTDRLTELPRWISAHLRANLSVEILAERACLCPRHFSRLFKTILGTTPATFVEDARLGEARRRLLTSRNSVESIAAAVGFRSGDAFRRAFERRIGMTPGRFRQTGQSAGGAIVPLQRLEQAWVTGQTTRGVIA